MYLDPTQTRWFGSFGQAGQQRLAVYVDSWNGYNKPAGFVLEGNETNNRIIREDIVVTAADVQSSRDEQMEAGPLPPRPVPQR